MKTTCEKRWIILVPENFQDEYYLAWFFSQSIPGKTNHLYIELYNTATNEYSKIDSDDINAYTQIDFFLSKEHSLKILRFYIKNNL